MTGALRKTYPLSLPEDASRLIAHSAFCPGEGALDIEGVLKQGGPGSRRPNESGTTRSRRCAPASAQPDSVRSGP